MPLLGLRFTVRRLMAAVAIAALASLAFSKVCRDYPSNRTRAVILLTSAVAGAVGVGALRRPLLFLVPVLVTWVVVPAVDHPSLDDALGMSAGGCQLGWMIGAPIGWISRGYSRTRGPNTA